MALSKHTILGILERNFLEKCSYPKSIAMYILNSLHKKHGKIYSKMLILVYHDWRGFW